MKILIQILEKHIKVISRLFKVNKINQLFKLINEKLSKK